MINTEVYKRTSEQRDYWQDMCGVYKARAERLEKIILQIDGKMGHGWTAKLADALTPLLQIDAYGNVTEICAEHDWETVGTPQGVYQCRKCKAIG